MKNKSIFISLLSFFGLLMSGCSQIPFLDEMLQKFNKKEEETETGHNFATEWDGDEESHWHVCLDEGCEEISDRSQHTFGEWFVSEPATCTSEGSQYRLCEVCGYEEVSSIPVLEHTLGEWISDDTGHWKVCDDCDGIFESSSHVFGEWIVSESPTCQEEGLKYHQCEVCGYIENDIVPCVDHVSSGLMGNESGHWCECVNCHEVLTWDEHNFGAWTIDKAPTCTDDGSQYRVCSDCGYTEHEIVEATGHSFASTWHENVVNATYTHEGSYDVYGHCENCSETLFIEHKIVDILPYSKGLSYKLNNDSDALAISGLGSCTDTHIIIPETHEDLPNYEELPVTTIGEAAFKDSAIQSVIIPDTVEAIEDKAFAGCDELVSISMPDDVEFGKDIFRDSINVEIDYRHELVHVEARESTCSQEGCIEHYYCKECHQYFADAEGQNRLYDISIPPAHEFVNGVCSHCGVVQSNLLIVSVAEVGDLGKFPLGTMEDVIGLPSEIKVQTADGVYHYLGVQWDLSEYDKSEVGEYKLQGILQGSGYYFQDESLKTVDATISITDVLVGTADIVFVLDISGSMGSYINQVKNNMNNFAQAIEDQGVSARWSVVTYSDEFSVPGDPKEKSQFVNGVDWYTNASDTRAAINSIQVAYGGDAPEAAVDGLMFAHENLTTRRDARIFYVLLTDINYKNDNNYGISGMTELVDLFVKDNICTCAIVPSGYYNTYSDLVTRTGGVTFDISGNFANNLNTTLISKIYSQVTD